MFSSSANSTLLFPPDGELLFFSSSFSFSSLTPTVTEGDVLKDESTGHPGHTTLCDFTIVGFNPGHCHLCSQKDSLDSQIKFLSHLKGSSNLVPLGNSPFLLPTSVHLFYCHDLLQAPQEEPNKLTLMKTPSFVKTGAPQMGPVSIFFPDIHKKHIRCCGSHLVCHQVI